MTKITSKPKSSPSKYVSKSSLIKKSTVKKRPVSKFAFLANRRLRPFLAAAAVAIVGTAFVVYSHAETISKAQCTRACAGIAVASDGNSKYWEVGVDGGVFSFGGAQFYGSLPGSNVIVDNVIGIAANSAKNGYWIATQTGDVYNYGAAYAPTKPNVSSYGAKVNNIVAIAAAPSGEGYYLAGSDGGVFAFNAPFHGSLGGQALAKPIVGMAVRQQGGYWLVGADGGVFAYGGAAYKGGLSGTALAQPIVAMTSTPSGDGYWLVGADGGVFAYGDAGFYGSVSNTKLVGPVNSISRTSSGKGYWLSAADGGVFAYGDAQYQGNAIIPPETFAPKPAPSSDTKPTISANNPKNPNNIDRPEKPGTPDNSPETNDGPDKPGDNPASKTTNSAPAPAPPKAVKGEVKVSQKHPSVSPPRNPRVVENCRRNCSRNNHGSRSNGSGRAAPVLPDNKPALNPGYTPSRDLYCAYNACGSTPPPLVINIPTTTTRPPRTTTTRPTTTSTTEVRD